MATTVIGGMCVTVNNVTDQQLSSQRPSGAVHELSHARAQEAETPQEFTAAVESMHAAQLRKEIVLGTIRPPQKIAKFSHAIGLEVDRESEDEEVSALDSEGDAFGRLILLYDPRSEEAWDSPMRLVAYIQADLDSSVAGDPLLPEVAWEWLKEGLVKTSATYTNLGGTVTSTASVRYGEIGGPPRAYQVELRASWTAADAILAAHVEGFAHVLAAVAGLPPVGVTNIGS